MKNRIPELSLADYRNGTRAEREAFSSALMQGLRRYGFIILRDHPVPWPLIDEGYWLCQKLFAQPDDIKHGYAGGPRGYAPLRTEQAKNHNTPDLKEFWQIGQEHHDAASSDPTQAPNIWPAAPEGFRDTFVALYRTLELTGRILLDALTPGLELPPKYFEPLVRGGNSILRLIHYPPVAKDVEPGSVRAAPHEDINLITLMVGAQGPGLELLDRDGRWLPVNADPDKLIVDSGDMLARLTNDVIPATTHRVVNPAGRNVSRYSMPFFMHPRSEMPLSCLPSCVGAGAKYPDITAGVFLEQRLREIGLIRG